MLKLKIQQYFKYYKFINCFSISRKNRDRTNQWAFDFAFDHYTSQDIVFEKTTSQLLDSVIDGYNCTTFAYGATGAGKTHTMVGKTDDYGMMQRSMNKLFQIINMKSNVYNIQVKASYLEIYNEIVKDLMSQEQKNIEIREDPSLGVNVIGLTQVGVSSTKDVMNLFKIGNKNRTMEATQANEYSSRSHAILQVFLEIQEKNQGINKQIQHSKLCMVDLAGSERAGKTNNRGQRLIEGAKINQSLLTLGNCIHALAEQQEKPNQNVFVPYRGSKLTRLLKDSLGGNCRTIMIANVSPFIESVEDTYNTLCYAHRAKQIKTVLTRNVVQIENHISNYADIIDGLRKENEMLKKQMGNQNNIMPNIDISMSNDNGNQQKQREKVSQLELELNKHFVEEMDTIKKIYEAEENLENARDNVIDQQENLLKENGIPTNNIQYKYLKNIKDITDEARLNFPVISKNMELVLPRDNSSKPNLMSYSKTPQQQQQQLQQYVQPLTKRNNNNINNNYNSLDQNAGNKLYNKSRNPTYHNKQVNNMNSNNQSLDYSQANGNQQYRNQGKLNNYIGNSQQQQNGKFSNNNNNNNILQNNGQRILGNGVYSGNYGNNNNKQSQRYLKYDKKNQENQNSQKKLYYNNGHLIRDDQHQLEMQRKQQNYKQNLMSSKKRHQQFLLEFKEKQKKFAQQRQQGNRNSANTLPTNADFDQNDRNIKNYQNTLEERVQDEFYLDQNPNQNNIFDNLHVNNNLYSNGKNNNNNNNNIMQNHSFISNRESNHNNSHHVRSQRKIQSRSRLENINSSVDNSFYQTTSSKSPRGFYNQGPQTQNRLQDPNDSVNMGYSNTKDIIKQLERQPRKTNLKTKLQLDDVLDFNKNLDPLEKQKDYHGQINMAKYYKQSPYVKSFKQKQDNEIQKIQNMINLGIISKDPTADQRFKRKQSAGIKGRSISKQRKKM
ncbi:P-loop containing nucleoside triphosphate hydrolase [Pseudocohnilembus persalinus]|uniref:Kinesin-like protein n=1 Tax=Pseudocohnilembus persalinus TaxID=266149 RepID=A0A0V0R4J0_PSEPJ|nr:P-loop containing nucleoside triphosphate hydrolase [Pseudocohnilembus persalinus]|eukprot:KRX09403.1 P-loop containing nucleoside triphosphate hydrolase [Pseudocohnilembus persalinus]